MLPWILARAGGNFRSQQVRNKAIFIGCPDGSIATQKCCARALFATKTERAVNQSFDEPLKAHGDFNEPPAKFLHHSVDHAAADDSLADRDRLRPLGAVREKI